MVTLSIEPTIDFNERSGMASSTRVAAIELWGTRLPTGDPEKTAKTLFCFDNPPGSEYISGSQDSIGIVFAGLAKANYAGDYWPESIEHVTDEGRLAFVEALLHLVPLGPREGDYDVLADTRIDEAGAAALATATQECWLAIAAQNASGFGAAVPASFDAQIAMFPNMVTPQVTALIDKYRADALGWKLTGAGGGGYLVVVSDSPVESAVGIVSRREAI